ncbi:MAG: hypothetical protein R3330_17715 [Saprospiraceae bacterium]|nr:hypothetical protein [Saprospiraceae bacterium]
MKHVILHLCWTLAALVAGQALHAQPRLTVGPALQIYPTGVIPSVFTHVHLDEHSAITVRLGYNMVDHGDAGVHDDEQGGGFGFTVGYQRRITSRWFGEVRSDLWFNELDWEDRNGDIVVAAGTTQVTVVQPTLKAGYRIPASEGRIEIIPSLAAGIEINVHTDGAAVGQGAIVLLGLALGIPLGR